MTSVPDREAMLSDLRAASDPVLLHAWRAARSASALDNLHRAHLGECLVALHLPGASFTDAWASDGLEWRGIKIEVKRLFQAVERTRRRA